MKKIFILLFFVSSYAMGQWFYGSGAAVNLENKIIYKNKVSAQTGNTTPTSGVNAATGSVYQKTDGTFWLKQAGATTSWARVATSSELTPYATSSELSNYVSKVSTTTQSMNAILGVGTVQATASAGLLLESNNGTDVALFGAGGGANATYYGGVTVNGQLKADGNADQAHLVVEGHSTQTSNLFEIYNNTPTYLAGFDQNGHLRMRDLSATSAANPQLYFITGANKTGVGYNSAGVNSELFFVTNGTSRLSLSLSGASFAGVVYGNGNGPSAPAFALTSSDSNTGLGYNSADNFCMSTGGTCRVTASNATTTISNNAVISGSTTLATSLTGALRASAGVVSTGSTSLTTEVTGTLPIANGGTGLTSVSSGSVLIASGSAYANYPGVTSGDVLTWNGSAWRGATPSGGSSSYSATASITITGSGSNPTKGNLSSGGIDEVMCAPTGVTGWYTCEYRYSHTNGASDGSGSYIFTLGNSCTLDTTYYTVYTGVDSSNVAVTKARLNWSEGEILDNSLNTTEIKAVAYSSTQFRVGLPGTTTTFFGSTYYNFGKNPLAFNFSIRFKGSCP